jgi:hypothetical protein
MIARPAGLIICHRCEQADHILITEAGKSAEHTSGENIVDNGDLLP